MAQVRAVAAGDGEPGRPIRVTPEIAAEAAVWVARLHGPQRCRQMERECLAWQQRSAAHRHAFERCTETWQSVPGVTLATAFAASDRARRLSEPGHTGVTRRWALTGAFGLCLTAGTVGYGYWRHFGAYATGVGEQRLVVLEDGTRMTLNTATSVRIDLGGRRREVMLRAGEALFEVAKDPARPFVVQVGRSEVVAVGTTFNVRFSAAQGASPERLALTLIEGRVALQTSARGPAGAPGAALQLEAGERVRVVGPGAGGESPAALQRDRPDLRQVTAWQRSEAVFDDVALEDAVAEMNRYNRTPIALRGAYAQHGLRISGVYRTGDPGGFARAVAALHGLEVREQEGRFVLTKPQ